MWDVGRGGAPRPPACEAAFPPACPPACLLGPSASRRGRGAGGGPRDPDAAAFMCIPHAPIPPPPRRLGALRARPPARISRVSPFPLPARPLGPPTPRLPSRSPTRSPSRHHAARPTAVCALEEVGGGGLGVWLTVLWWTMRSLFEWGRGEWGRGWRAQQPWLLPFATRFFVRACRPPIVQARFWLLSTAAPVRACDPPTSLRRRAVWFRSLSRAPAIAPTPPLCIHLSLDPLRSSFPLDTVVSSPPSPRMPVPDRSLCLTAVPFFPLVPLPPCLYLLHPLPLPSTPPPPRPMGVREKAPPELVSPHCSGLVPVAPVTINASGKPPQPPVSRLASARVEASTSFADAADAGVRVGGGSYGDDGGLGACEVGPVARIVRPTNPMTRDPAFVLALLHGERVGGGGWSAGGGVGVWRGSTNRIALNSGSGEDWRGSCGGGEAV